MAEDQKLRYFPNNSSTFGKVPDARKELISCLITIVNGAPPRKPWGGKFVGVYSGPTSIAYMSLWLSRTHPDLIIEGKNGKEWCENYLNCGSDEIGIEGVEGVKGMGIKNEYLAWRAVKAALTKDMRIVKEMLEDVKKLHESISGGENELFDGRAGTLALLREVRFWVPGSKEMVDGVMKTLIRHIIDHRPWTWYDGSEFLGAAHGVVGIVLQVVLCDPAFAGELEGVLEEVLNQQEEDGNWYIKMGKSDKGGYVQWCHGSPGVVIGLVKMRDSFPGLKDKLDLAIEKGRKNIWEKGILIKEPCLCHGISGNMLALGKDQPEHFMSFATRDRVQQGIKDGSVIEANDDRYGLFFGEPGRAWAWMVLDSGQDLGFPSYSTEA